MSIKVLTSYQELQEISAEKDSVIFVLPDSIEVESYEVCTALASDFLSLARQNLIGVLVFFIDKNIFIKENESDVKLKFKCGQINKIEKAILNLSNKRYIIEFLGLSKGNIRIGSKKLLEHIFTTREKTK
jgi:hypothetical protein